MGSDGSLQDLQFVGFKQAHGRMYASALAIQECPAFWTHYSGAPAFCCEQVWSLRTLARASGGFSRLPLAGNIGSQEALLQAEAAQDASYTFYYLDGAWVPALDLKPPGQAPGATTRLHILSRRPMDEVLSVRQAIFAERSREGLTFLREQWHFDTLTVMRRAQQRGDLTAKEIE